MPYLAHTALIIVQFADHRNVDGIMLFFSISKFMIFATGKSVSHPVGQTKRQMHFSLLLFLLYQHLLAVDDIHAIGEIFYGLFVVTVLHVSYELSRWSANAE